VKAKGLFRDLRMDAMLGKSAVVEKALRQAIEDLEAYHGIPIEALAERYWTSPKGPKETTSEALRVFYAQSIRYLYESTYTEGYLDHQRLAQTVLRWIQGGDRQPVLDFGGGGGGLALALAKAGVEVEYADVPGVLTDFVRWRFERHGVSIPILDVAQPLPKRRYGSILAVDVLEHLSNLEEDLNRLSCALRPGGWLVVTHSFGGDDPLHLASSQVFADWDRFNRWMESRGWDYGGRLKPDPISEWIQRTWQIPVVFGIRLSRRRKAGGNLCIYRTRPV